MTAPTGPAGSAMQQLYQQVILDHARERHGQGLRQPFEAESHQVNPTCGDEVTLRVSLDAARTAVTDVSWEGEGCSISTASISVMVDLVSGRPLTEVRTAAAAFHELMHSRGQGEPDEDLLGDGAAFGGVSRFPARVKCALLGWMALADALLAADAKYRCENRSGEETP